MIFFSLDIFCQTWSQTSVGQTIFMKSSDSLFVMFCLYLRHKSANTTYTHLLTVNLEFSNVSIMCRSIVTAFFVEEQIQMWALPPVSFGTGRRCVVSAENFCLWRQLVPTSMGASKGRITVTREGRHTPVKFPKWLFGFFQLWDSMIS